MKEEKLDGAAQIDAINLERNSKKPNPSQVEESPEDILFRERAQEVRSHKNETNVMNLDRIIIGDSGGARTVHL